MVCSPDLGVKDKNKMQRFVRWLLKMKNIFEKLFERNKLNRSLHWTTIASEKTLLAVIGCLTVLASIEYVWGMFQVRSILLPDLFMLFIYAEIIGMIGAFYSTNRIPITLPIIIAMTALCRLIVMQSKDIEPSILLAEVGEDDVA